MTYIKNDLGFTLQIQQKEIPCKEMEFEKKP